MSSERRQRNQQRDMYVFSLVFVYLVGVGRARGEISKRFVMFSGKEFHSLFFPVPCFSELTLAADNLITPAELICGGML